MDLHEPDWWRIFVFKILRENHFSIEWINKSSFKEILSEFLALQKYSELKFAIDEDEKIDRDIFDEVSKPKDVGDGKTIPSTNIPQQMIIGRKDYYDYNKYREFLENNKNE